MICGVGGVDVKGLVERKGGDVPGVVLEHRLDEGGADGLVADGVGEDVDVRVDEAAGVFGGVDVGGDFEVVLVRLFDDGGVDLGVISGILPWPLSTQILMRSTWWAAISSTTLRPSSGVATL